MERFPLTRSRGQAAGEGVIDDRGFLRQLPEVREVPSCKDPTDRFHLGHLLAAASMSQLRELVQDRLGSPAFPVITQMKMQSEAFV